MEAFLLNVLHSLQRDGYLLSNACDVWEHDVAFLLVLDEQACFLELPPQTMMLLGKSMALRLATRTMDDELLHDAYGSGNLYPSSLALYATMAESVGVLGSGQCGHAGGIMAGECAAEVHAVVSRIGGVGDGAWRSEEADGETEVVDIEVHEASSSHLRIKDGGYLSPQITVVARTALCIVGIDHAWGAQ